MISDPSSQNDQKHIICKQFFPLINGGINIINVSSDELVTSQYINGFKTATLASIPANDLKVSTHSLLNFSLHYESMLIQLVMNLAKAMVTHDQ